MAGNSDTSGFVPPKKLSISHTFEEIQKIPSKGFSLLLRAKRNGQWWMLKGLKPEFRNDFVYQELLHKEYNILSIVKGQYVVAASGMENVDGYGECIVMEWVDGITLKQWLTLRPTRMEKRRVVSQLLDALQSVHGKQVVHRDLKLENVMVTRNGQNVKLIDFGLADTDSYAVFKQPAGTDGFISPEQSSTSLTDCRNDIYSLGCILQLMNLGWIYRSVIARCLAPAVKRYEDVETIRSAMRSVRRRMHVACLLIVFFLFSGG